MCADYQYDVFISYSRSRLLRDWVGNIFLEQFNDRLSEELVKKSVRLFWDDQELEVVGARPQLEKALCTSRFLVAVWTPTYFVSSWCMAEWQTFLSRSQAVHCDPSELIGPIQWKDGDKYPPEANKAWPADFHDYARTGDGFKKTEAYVKFQELVDKFAMAVAKKVQSVPPFKVGWPMLTPEDIEQGRGLVPLVGPAEIRRPVL